MVGAALLALRSVAAQEHHAAVGYEDTPMLPGGKWHVHDGKRPQPKVITPGTCSSQQSPGQPPSDATVLFDGKDLSNWESIKGGPAGWKVEDGYAEVVAGAGDIRTRQEFGDMQLHLEWREPTPPKGESQERGNSGVFLIGAYEIQVLDAYNNITYPDGQTGAVYGQYPPFVNACRPPGEWQTYDIIFTVPRFQNGELKTPAYVTVLQNGVAVQNHSKLLGDTGHRILATYVTKASQGPLRLQDHGNKVRYRNIWVRTLGSNSNE
ncbi:MAG: DUF1080 domain-containing protein [Acidobacteriia bacterium]|nr:DUF1080 domain-containing protein [Terriglobia bacterium]